MKPEPIAVLCSDLHLTLRRPACRAGTNDDWMNTQIHYLMQLRKISHAVGGLLPVICAGDIFDRWNAPPELINFALGYLPDGMICVPGQHDLPNHRMEEMHRSGYGVLAKAEKIVDLSSSDHYPGPECNFVAHGFGWERNIKPFDINHPSSKVPSTVHIAVVHRYIWTSEADGYPGAPEDSMLTAFKPIFNTYDAVVVGDNHKGWIRHKLIKHPSAGAEIFNCGGFIRRKSDEINYKPTIGKLYSDGSIQRIYLDTSFDKFQEASKQREELEFDMKRFIEQLEGLGEHGLDFAEAIKNHLRTEDLDKETKEIILEALEEQR